MDTNIMSNEIFTSILADMDIKSPVDKIEIDGLMDTPGHHWSNPGVKQISVYAGSQEYRFVLKTLAEHSKREIDVYKFLNTIEDFPVPRLYHNVYDEENDEYRMIIERCMVRDFPAPEEFWKECGTLLARIHSAFWGNIADLPSLFHLEPEINRLTDAIESLNGFLCSLSDSAADILNSEVNGSLTDLKSCLGEIDKEHIPDLPVSNLCLLHGSFHSPEIMWRKTFDGYIPLGVDWEGCRIGHPSEDLAFGVQNLLPKEECMLFDTFMDTYLDELAACGIHPDRENLFAAAKQEAFIKTTGSVIPFLLQTYLEVHDDKSYRKWGEWMKGSLPDTIRYIRNLISSGEIYTPPIPG